MLSQVICQKVCTSTGKRRLQLFIKSHGKGTLQAAVRSVSVRDFALGAAFIEFYDIIASSVSGWVSRIGPILPFVLVIGIFYVLVFLPQRKRQKQMQEMVSTLKTGDKVITSSGIIGTITSIKDDSLMLRTGQVNIEVQRSSVAAMQTDGSTEVKGNGK